jgi:GT2 family glycosyltransferase
VAESRNKMTQDIYLPRISVVTPSLNQGRYLRKCIESIFSQGYPNLEFLVIDGGSTDESLSVIREYANRIDYWVSEPDAGQSDAINKGFKRANGELVAWLNADDFYLPGAFERIAEAYRANRLAPFYFGDGHRVDIEGNFISKFFPPGSLHFDRQALVMGLNYILQPSTFIHRGALERAGYLDTGLHYGMDSDLWMRLSALGEPVAVASALSASREYAATKTASGSFARVEELRKISMKHSGVPMTPGVVCYFLDTLHRMAKEQEGVFPPAYVDDIVVFWQKTSGLFERFNARPDGFPLPAGLDATPHAGTGGKLNNIIRPFRASGIGHHLSNLKKRINTFFHSGKPQ